MPEHEDDATAAPADETPADAKAKAVQLPRGIIRNTSVATRLSLVIVLVALISLVITSLVGLQRGGQLADGLLRDRMTAIGAGRADEVERYIRNVQRISIAQAISPATADAIAGFSDGFDALMDQQPSDEQQQAVDDFYADVVAPELSEVRGRPVTASSLIPTSPAGVQLQANYVVPGDGEGSLIEDAGDGSQWTELHSVLHQSFTEVAIQAGVDDLYLIEPNNETIVYSSAKAIDFGTSLRVGPQSGSALAVLIGAIGDDAPAGTVAVADFTGYAATGGLPSAFVASPVVVDDRLAGYVALRFGGDEMTALTSDDGAWTSQGDSGESFLVADDDLMRSDARAFVEDQDSYLEAVTAAGAASDEQVRLMDQLGTTVLLQPVDDAAVDGALADDPDIVETTNLLGVQILQARRALDIEGLEWAMLTEVELVEIEQPITDFARNLLIAIALFLVAITFLASRWANRLLSPVRLISSKLRAIQAGEELDESNAADLPESSATEFVVLADDIDTMLVTLEERNAAARSRADERKQLLRRLLPPQAVQRAEAGERNVVDQVAHATIAVVVIHGMGRLLQSGSTDEARTLLDRFVEEVDDLARQRGLERIRLTGDSYVAGCGTVRPLIDHTARTASFVLDVLELVDDVGDEAGPPITVGVGIDSGPVTVGLTGGAGLVYDAWGATVQRAADLARRADDNSVLVSAAARAQLPSTFETAEHDRAADTFAVTSRRDEAGVT